MTMEIELKYTPWNYLHNTPSETGVLKFTKRQGYQVNTGNPVVDLVPLLGRTQRTLKVMEDQLEDVKADRDEWRKQANQLLLSAPTARKKFLGIF